MFEVCAYWLAGGMLLEFRHLSVLQAVCVLASVALLLRVLFAVPTYAVSFRHASVRPAHCPRTLFGMFCLLIHEAAASFRMCSVRSNLDSACVVQPRHMLTANRQSPYYSCTAISAMRRIGDRWPGFLRRQGLEQLYAINFEPMFGCIDDCVAPLSRKID